MHQLYKNIKKLREEKNISQEQLANLTGYTSRSTITRIENGEIDLSLSKIEQFAKVFGKEPSELVGWEDDEQHKTDSPKILQYYNQLNDIGQHVATERVKELTEVSRYVKEDTTYVNAAHANEGATEEEKQHDEDIMDAEDF